ncbi:tripartite tricarboxylate transporter permease [Sabulicella rubraurantiaca]|uniref:tripartite tricarboxylate transporter permease n=1 Tax=Sabulicella rubraurantiaca TaxID=2811429 RepID=UPI001A968E3B|nr:tripartite tricarboxylate transporter permease [Sabulicella rubraurantiaca]
MMEGLLHGFAVLMTVQNVTLCILGAVLGTLVGVLPGLGPATTIALLLPISLKLDPTGAIILLAGIYYGVAYGGTITSVLMRIPGEASSVVTCIDGHAMAKRGRAGAALGIAAIGSFIAGTFGILGVMLLSPPLAEIVIAFGPWEYAALMLAGLSLIAFFAASGIAKAALMAFLGLFLGLVGLDPISGTPRFTFGVPALVDGVNIAPLALGLFGLSELLFLALSKDAKPEILRPPSTMLGFMPNREEWKRSAAPIARGSVLGFFVGLLPGGGAVLASFLSYAVEKRLTRHPDEFGKGAIEGVAGPESANNSGTAGAFIPLLTLGIPANAVTALLLGALLVHGVQPGPMILERQPELYWGVIASMYFGNFILLVLNLPFVGLFVRALEVPRRYMATAILLICAIGTWSVGLNHFDVLMAVVFGFVGFALRRGGFDLGPLVLAYVLGPTLERSLRQALLIADGDVTEVVNHPIALGFLAAAALILLSGMVMRRRPAVVQDGGS